MKTTSATPNLVPLPGGDRGGLPLTPTQAPISNRSLALIRALLAAFIFCCLVHPAYGQFGLTNGLVAYYPFDGDANDASGSGNNGLIYGAIPAPDRSGRPNTCFKFTGTTNWIRLNVGPSLFASNFTIAVWIKIDDLQAHFPAIVEADTGYVRLQVLGSLPSYISEGYFRRVAFYQFQPGSGQQFGILIATNLLNSNQWYHVAIVRSGLNFQMYLDGMPGEQKTESGSITLTGNYLQVGNDADGTNQFFHGDIDDLRIYNRAFSSNEVQTLFLQHTPLTATISPSSVTVLPGNDVAFYANGLGVPPIIYQWFLNNVPITNSARIVGATSSLLTISNAQPQDTGAYSVRVANASGTNASGTSVLTVYDGDADGDGLPNSWENAFGLNPNNSSDATNNPLGDQLTYLHKYLYGLNPLTTDNDGDGLSDYDELFVHATNPFLSDTDGDRIPDDWEVQHGLNSRFNDASDDFDADGLSNYSEFNWSTNHSGQLLDPRKKYSTSPTLSDFAVVTGASTNLFFYDRNDRLVGAEYDRGLVLAYVYDGNDNLTRQVAMMHDSNTNGLPDLWEFMNGLTNNAGAFTDTDGDGWSDWQEWKSGTQPINTASAPNLLGNPGTNIATLTLPFIPSNFVVGVGQLDGSGAEEIVIGADGNPGSTTNFLLVLTQGPTSWSTQRVDVGPFGITSIAVGQVTNRSSAGIYVGLRGMTNGSGRVIEYVSNGSTWQSNLVALSTNRTAFVLGVRGQDVLVSVGSTNALDGSLSAVSFVTNWNLFLLNTNISHRGLGRASESAQGLAYDTFTTGFIATGTLLTMSHTCAGSGPILLAFVIGAGSSQGDVITGVTYNGMPMTKIHTLGPVVDSGSDRYRYTFLMTNPPSGSHAIIVSASSSTFIQAFTLSYTGAKQAGQPGAQGTSIAASGTSFSHSLTTLDDNSWLVGFVTTVFSTALPGSGVTLRSLVGSAQVFDSGGSVGPPGNHSLNYTASGSTDWGSCMVAISPSPNVGIGLRLLDGVGGGIGVTLASSQSELIIPEPSATRIQNWRGQSLVSGFPRQSSKNGHTILYTFADDKNANGLIDFADDFVTAEYLLIGTNASLLTTNRQPIATLTPAQSYGLASVNFLNSSNEVFFTGEPDGQVFAWTATGATNVLQRQLFSGHHVGKAWHAMSGVKTLEPGEALIGLRVDPASLTNCDVILWSPQQELPQLANLPNTAPAAAVLPTPNGGGNPASVSIRIWDAEGNASTPFLQYQAAGSSNWNHATITYLDGAGYSPSFKTSATPTGSVHTLVWNTGIDLGPGITTNVMLRVRALDVTLLGEWSAPMPYTVQGCSDCDMDGLPDAWEVQYFGSTNAINGGATDDPDGDGFTTGAEYVADTNPNDTNSVLRITSISSLPASLRVEWRGGMLATQYLQHRFQLGATNENWTNIFTNPPPTPITNHFDVPGTNRMEWFRVRVVR